MTIISIDPSGEFTKSKGSSGIAIGGYDKSKKYPSLFLAKTIKARDYNTKNNYYQEHLNFLLMCKNQFQDMVVVIEDFKIRPSQTHYNDGGETLKLIQVIQNFCDNEKITYFMQGPGQVKPRWKNQVLQNLGFLKTRPYLAFLIDNQFIRIDKHQLDAIRHLYHLTVCNKYFTHH